MECSEIRAILYKSLEPNAPRDFDENVRAHVEECPACARLLSNLHEQADALYALPRVKAPGGFLGQVRSRIEKPSVFAVLRRKVSDLWGSRQFFQFAGVAVTATLIVVTAQIMLKDESKQQSPVFLPSQPAETRSAPPAGPDLRPGYGMEKGFHAESVEPKIEQVPEKAPGPQVFSDLAQQGRQPSIHLKLKPHPAAREEEKRMPENTASRAPAAPPSSRKEKRPSTSVRIHSDEKPELQSAVSEVRRLILTSNGRILSTEPPQNRAAAAQKMLLAEIPHSKYPTLLDELRKIGALDISKSEYPEGPDSFVRVTIHFE